MSVPVCPGCGTALAVVVAGPATAPWRCGTCRYGYWDREVAPDAAAAWRREHDFGFGETARTIAREVKGEHAAAHARGVSVREDQIHLLDAAQRALLARWPALSGSLRTAVERTVP